MKFSLSWLKQYLQTDATAGQVAAKLNAIGLEVEGVEDPALKLAGFRVAKVLTADRHPDADKLQVLTVDAGDGKPLQVVCGAPNARTGLVGVLGLPGAVVPANGMTLKVAGVRGVESNGMMCSTRELELGAGRRPLHGPHARLRPHVVDHDFADRLRLGRRPGPHGDQERFPRFSRHRV